MGLRCSVSTEVGRGNGLTLQKHGQGGFPTDVRKTDQVLTYCSVSTEVRKDSELTLQMEELPIAFRKISRGV